MSQSTGERRSTTFEQVAERARAGKTTIYARYPTKEILFAAAVHRTVQTVLGRISRTFPEPVLRDRLTRVGLELAREILVPEVIALMRVTAAEAGRFPELAQEAYGIGFGGGVDFVARSIAGPDQGAEAIAAATPAAIRFVEAALHPLQMRALFGADLAALRDLAPRYVEAAVTALAGAGLLEP